MKTYKCDSCEREIKDPYKQYMKEFRVVYDEDGPWSFKYRKKIHLCEDCFYALRSIAAKAGKANV